MKKDTRWMFAAAVLVLAILTGCNAGDHAEAVADHAEDAADAVADHAEAAVEHVTGAVEASPAMTAVLMKADMADGTEDNVVAKCPGCALAMEGSADHAMEVGDYSLHFCSDECKHKFGEDATQAILDLPVGGGDTDAASD